MKRAGLAVVMLVLAACGSSSDWTKPGVAPQTAASDQADCESQARSATQRDDGIDADILASRGGDWQRTGTLALKRDDMAGSNRDFARRIISRCMTAKGYVPAP